jgi:hypothetical protein
MDRQSLPHEQCTLCGALSNREVAYYKAGKLEKDSGIPPAAANLVVIQDTSTGSRLKQVKQCPQCKTYYRFWTDYEFLAGGTEDEEFLIRLRPEQVKDYLLEPPKKKR